MATLWVRAAGVVKQPPKQDAPDPVLRKRLVLLTVFVAVAFFGSVLYFSLENVTFTEYTWNMDADCPLLVHQQTIDTFDAEGSWSAFIKDPFNSTSFQECYDKLDWSIRAQVDITDEVNCKVGALDTTTMFCQRNLFQSYTEQPQFIIRMNFVMFTVNLTEYCPSYPAAPDNCDTLKVVNRTGSIVCVRLPNGKEFCTTEGIRSPFPPQAICDAIWDRQLPQLCVRSGHNTIMTILSLTINNTSSVFAIALSIGWLLFPYQTLEEQRQEQEAIQRLKEQREQRPNDTTVQPPASRGCFDCLLPEPDHHSHQHHANDDQVKHRRQHRTKAGKEENHVREQEMDVASQQDADNNIAKLQRKKHARDKNAAQSADNGLLAPQNASGATVTASSSAPGSGDGGKTEKRKKHKKSRKKGTPNADAHHDEADMRIEISD